MPRAGTVVLAVLVTALSWSVRPAVVRADGARMTAVVRLAPKRDALLWQRVRGQTVDLDVTLVEVRSAVAERDARAQLRAAAALAREHGARVVVWFVHDERGGVAVCVAEPAAGRLLLRQLDAGAATDVARSAIAEEAAVVVRSALRALAAGGRIGVEVEVDDAVEPAPDDELPRRRARESSPTDRLAVLAAVGWQAVADGASERGFHALTARLGVARGRLGLSLSASASAPVTLDDELTSVELSRHALWLSGHVELWRGPRAALAGELGVGVVGFFRATDARSPAVAPTPSQRTAALLISPALRWQWRLSAGGGVALELVAAADGLLGAPELGYEVAGRFVRRDRLWPLQPRVGASIVVEFNGVSGD